VRGGTLAYFRGTLTTLTFQNSPEGGSADFHKGDADVVRRGHCTLLEGGIAPRTPSADSSQSCQLAHSASEPLLAGPGGGPAQLRTSAAGCNGVPHAASWGPSGLLRVGPAAAVIVCDPGQAQAAVLPACFRQGPDRHFLLFLKNELFQPAELIQPCLPSASGWVLMRDFQLFLKNELLPAWWLYPALPWHASGPGS